MGSERGLTRTAESASPIGYRAATKLPAKGAGEDFVARESAGERDIEHRGIRSEELPRRAFQADTLNELPRGLPEHAAQRTMQVERRVAGPAGEQGERHGTLEIAPHVAQ
jgi:hypothetical protein